MNRRQKDVTMPIWFRGPTPRNASLSGQSELNSGWPFVDSTVGPCQFFSDRCWTCWYWKCAVKMWRCGRLKSKRTYGAGRRGRLLFNFAWRDGKSITPTVAWHEEMGAGGGGTQIMDLKRSVLQNKKMWRKIITTFLFYPGHWDIIKTCFHSYVSVTSVIGCCSLQLK